MWLLSTDRLELVHFNNAQEVRRTDCAWATRDGYAILSHVWAHDRSEQTFADIQRLRANGVTSYDNPEISAKIRGCVRAARERGFCWIWNDTCCIDTTSSAELEEAINSMFRWYAEAAVCLAYLQDVPDHCPVDDMDSAFRKSVWFKRGWTLQELLAPHHVIFLSVNWKHLGTKVGLADLLQEITDIDADVLTFHRPLQHGRDRAYSLLGIFNVSMATVYGEGVLAFRRLQVKIMKRTPDHTLFAWGDMWRLTIGEQLPLPVSARTRDTTPPPSEIKPITPRFMQPSLDNSRSLFAPSPSEFAHAAMVVTTLKEVVERSRGFFDVVVPPATDVHDHVVTSSGVRCRFVVVPGNPFSLALLLCKNLSGECLALPLWPQTASPHRLAGFRAGVTFMNSPYRLIPLCRANMQALRDLGWKPRTLNARSSLPTAPCATVQTIYIANIHISSLPLRDPHLEREPRLLYLPGWLTTYLALYELEFADSPALDKADEPPSLLRIVHRHYDSEDAPRETAFVIHFCHCGGNLSAFVDFPSDGHARSYAQDAREPPPRPACHPRDPLGPHCAHLNSWKNGSRTFVDGDKSVRLSVTLWPTPKSYCFEIRLVGEYFASLRTRSPDRSLSPLMAQLPSPAMFLLPLSYSSSDAGSGGGFDSNMLRRSISFAGVGVRRRSPEPHERSKSDISPGPAVCS